MILKIGKEMKKSLFKRYIPNTFKQATKKLYFLHVSMDLKKNQ